MKARDSSFIRHPLLLASFRQVLAGQLDELGKGVGVRDRQAGQCLAVQGDAGPLQAGDELAVAHTSHPAGGFDAYDPQLAELALAHSAVAEGIDAGTNEGDDRLT